MVVHKVGKVPGNLGGGVVAVAQSDGLRSAVEYAIYRE